MKKSPQWKDMAWGHFYGLAHLLFLNVHSLFLLLTRSLSLSPFYFLEVLLFSVSLISVSLLPFFFAPFLSLSLLVSLHNSPSLLLPLSSLPPPLSLSLSLPLSFFLSFS